ncbi:MAG: spermidine synthase [Actinobacteria bacterium]|nr:spermidine synthase [Actinomycetota bacterium]
MDTGKTSAREGVAVLQASTSSAHDQQLASPARLAFASFLMLFVELALIRWVGANNVFVNTASNFVLLASFLGIGIGFLNARAGRDYLRLTPVALLALVGFVLAFPVALRLSGPVPFMGRGNLHALPQPLSLAIVFVLVVAVMAGLGQGVARTFVTFPPLNAYRLDILGSIAGIAAFSVLSFLNQPPATWGAVVGVGLVVLLLPRPRWRQLGALAGVIMLLVFQSLTPGQMWSPYNKLSIQNHGGPRPAVAVFANNIPYQTAVSLGTMRRIQPFYFYPYRHVTRASLANVLIIGAGSGNDVAVALSSGARHIDAVEIDPLLVQRVGQDHPNHPYRSGRVTRYVDDGRAFLEDTGKRYNLILLALPDSMTALAGQSALRLESYLLTSQALAAARSHLAPGGTFSMYNYYQPFLLDRYATTIQDVFRQTPCSELQPGQLGGRLLAVLTVHPGGPVPGCATYWNGTRLAPATDDHPFPYLASSAIPVSFLWMLGAILLGSLLLIRLAGGRFGGMRTYLDLAFMGAAFLLLETKNIVQFALLFGTTWLVNSLVFAGVLLAVYLAVETARHVRLPRPWVLYGALIASLALAWLVPQDSLLALPVIPRFFAGSALAFAPIFLANLVFAQRFADVQSSGTAFAVNLLGAMVGGALEYLSLITGYHVLLLVIGVLYGLAFATGLRRGSAPRPA